MVKFHGFNQHKLFHSFRHCITIIWISVIVWASYARHCCVNSHQLWNFIQPGTNIHQTRYRFNNAKCTYMSMRGKREDHQSACELSHGKSISCVPCASEFLFALFHVAKNKNRNEFPFTCSTLFPNRFGIIIGVILTAHSTDDKFIGNVTNELIS